MIKHAGNNAINCVKKTIEQRTVIDEEIPKIFVNGKNAMTMSDINQFKRHTGSTFHGIFVATGRTKATMAMEGNKFKLSTMCADVHGTTESRVTTVDHFINIFHLSVSGMKSIFNFFIIVGKDFL